MKNVLNHLEKSFHDKNLENDMKLKTNFEKSLVKMKDWEINRNESDNRTLEFIKSELLKQFETSKKDGQLLIDVFDRNMARLGLDVGMIDPKFKKSSKVKVSTEMLMQKIKEKIENNKQAKKEKDKRQRKVFYEQNKAQQALEVAKKKQELEKDNFDVNNLSDNIVNSEKVKFEIEKLEGSHKKQLEFEKWRYIHDRYQNTLLRNKNFYEKLELAKPYNDDNVVNFTYQTSQLDKNINEFVKDQFYEELNKVNIDYFNYEIEKKKRKRAETINNLNDVVDSILELVDECHDYQIKNNKEFIDENVWVEWMDSFINNKPISKYRYFIKEKKEEEAKALLNPFQQELFRFGKYESDSKDDFINFSVENFSAEDLEYLDYEYFAGNWKDKVFEENNYAEEQLKVRDVVSEQVIYNILGIKPSYNRNFDKEIELKDEHIECLKIPKLNTNNEYATEIIETLLELKYIHIPLNQTINTKFTLPTFDPIQEYKYKQNIMSSINIKIAIVGKIFSGKKSVTKFITDTYPWLKIYNVKETINKYFEIIKKLEVPIESNPKYKTMKKPQIEQLQKERELEEQKIAANRSKLDILYKQSQNNEELNPDILLDLLIDDICNDFSIDNGLKLKTETSHGNVGFHQNQYFEEIIIKNKRKAEIEEELNKIKEETLKTKKNPRAKEEQTLIQELAKLNTTTYTGFIILNLPQNINQGKLLELKLTNFIPEIERKTADFYLARDQLSVLFCKMIKSNYNKPHTSSTLNKILVIDCDTNECLRRFTLRRIDPNTNITYHLEDNPPPNDQKIIERLKPLEEQENETSIKTKNKEFDFEIANLDEFYDIFKFMNAEKEKHSSIMAINNQNNQDKKKDENTDRNNKETINVKSMEEENNGNNNNAFSLEKFRSNIITIIDTKNPLYNPNFSNENQVEETSKNKKEDKDKNKKNPKDVNIKPIESLKYKPKEKLGEDATFLVQKLIEEFEEKNVEKLKAYMQEKEKNEKGFNQFNYEKTRGDALKDKSIMMVNNKGNMSGRLSKQFSISAFGDDLSGRDHNLEDDDLPFSFNYKIVKKINECKKKIEPTIMENLFSKIVDHQFKFENEVKSILFYFKEKRNYYSKTLNNFQETFIKFITKSSKKKELVDQHKQYHNKLMIEQYIYYKKNPELKARLIESVHSNVDILHDKLWDIIDSRKKEAIEELSKIRYSGWVETEMEKQFIVIYKLFELEIIRLTERINLFKEFYYLLDNKIVYDTNSINLRSILSEGIEDYLLEKIQYNKKTENENNKIDWNFINEDYIHMLGNVENNEALFNENNNDQDNEFVDDEFGKIKYSEVPKIKINNNKNNISGMPCFLPKEHISNNQTNILNQSHQGGGMFPRIEKLYKNCLNYLFKLEEANLINEKKAIVQEISSIKKLNQLKHKKTTTTNTIIEDKDSSFSWEEEFKKVILLERSKFRFKISRIRHWATKSLFAYRQLSERVFLNMDNWIIKSVKAENNAMNLVIALCRQGIDNLDNNSPLRFNEEMDSFDIFDKLEVEKLFVLLMNDTIKTKVYPKLLESDTLFIIKDLKSIYLELKKYETQPNYVYSFFFFEFYMKRLAFNNSIDNRKLNWISSIPNSVKPIYIGTSNYYYFVNMLNENGYLNLKVVMTYLVLLHCKICDEIQGQHIISTIGNVKRKDDIEGNESYNISTYSNENEKEKSKEEELKKFNKNVNISKSEIKENKSKVSVSHNSFAISFEMENKNLIRNCFINKQTYENIDFWFDNDDHIIDLNNNNSFKVKEFIWEINQKVS